MLALLLDLGGKPGQVADDHAGQQQEHRPVEYHCDLFAGQHEVTAGHDQGGDRAGPSPVPHRPGQDGSRDPGGGHRRGPMSNGGRVLQRHGAQHEAGRDHEIGDQPRRGATLRTGVGKRRGDRPRRHQGERSPRPVLPGVLAGVDDAD